MGFTVLDAESLEKGISFHRPDHTGSRKVDLDSEALEVMTDFKRISAVTIGPNETIDEANEKMKTRGVRLLLVVDVHEAILGLITTPDIQGEKPVQYLHDNGGKREDIRVRDIMVPQSRLQVLTIQAASSAKVGDVVETLRSLKRQHAVVVDHQGPGGKRTIRGLFSLNQIARQLGINIQTYEMAHTLSEIAHAMTPR